MAKLTPYPEEGELVVGTVKTVQNFGAFITLDEYPGREGFCHIREVAAGWVKRIRDHIREQQRLVFKVLGVDRGKGHIDLSLKAVNDHQRRETIQRWKNEQKADKLLEMFAQESGRKPEEVQAEVAPPLLRVWDTLYDAFQEVSERGDEVLKEEGIEAAWGPRLVEFCKQNIQLQYVELHGFVDIASHAPQGVIAVRAALEAAEESPFDDVKVTATYTGAPHYRLLVQAPDFKIAEDQLKLAAERAIKSIRKAGGRGAFHRELEEVSKA